MMSSKETQFNLGVTLCLLAVGVSLRLLPHPANFAPVAAIAIFGGAILPRRLAVLLPVAAMIVSDAFIGLYSYKIMFVVWSCYALIAFASSRWLNQPTLKKGAALTVSGSIFFFAATNFATWAWGNMYAHSWSGLAQCFALALPFFRNTLLSDLFYTAALFGLYSCATQVAAKKLFASGTNSQVL